MMGHAPQIVNTEAYFSAINPIALKIAEDIRTTKSTYQLVWDELKYNEQCDLINNTLIQPEITLRYLKSFSTSISAASTVSSAISSDDHHNHHHHYRDGSSERLLNPNKISSGNNTVYIFDEKCLKTFNNQETGQKLIHDDTIGCFRDEHSGPFSFKTRSQLDLKLFDSTESAGVPGTAFTLRKILNAKLKLSPPSCELSSSSSASRAAVGNPKKPNFSASLKPITNLPVAINSSNRNHETFDGGLSTNNQDNSITNSDIPQRFSRLTLNETDSNRNGLFMRFLGRDEMLFNADSVDLSQAKFDDELLVASGSYESKGLVTGASIGQEDSSNSLQSEDDDKHIYEESRSLLNSSTQYDMRKGFEFLSNW